MKEKEKTGYILAQISKIEELVRSIEDSESLVQTFTQAFPVIIFWIDPQGRTNDFFTLDRSLLYADPKRFLGKFIHEVLPKETGEKIEKAVREAIETNRAIKIEYSLPMATGEEMFEASCLPFKGKNVFAIVKNITILKKAQDALPIEREFRNQLIQSSPAFFIAFSPNGEILQVNDAFLRTSGYKLEDVIGKDYIDTVIPQQDRKRVREAFRNAVKGKEPLSGMGPGITKDGKVLFIERRTTPVLDKDGKLEYFIGFGIDVTERERAIEELKKERTLLNRVLEASPVGILVLDKDAKLQYFSPMFEDIIGMKKEDIVRLTPEKGRQLVFGPDGKKVEDKDQIIRGILPKGEPVFGIHRKLVRGDGVTIDTLLNIVPLLGTDKRPEGMVITVEDITERMRAEDGLKEEMCRAQMYLDMAGTMLIVINPDEKVAMINKKGCQILGRPEKDIVGRNWFDDFLPKQIGQSVKAVFRELIQGHNEEAVEHYENPIINAKGEERLIAWTNTVLHDDKGRILSTLSSGEDITDRKKDEEALRQKSEFLEGVLNNASDGIFVLDEDTNYVYINEECGKILGLQPNNWIGKRAGLPVHPDDTERVLSHFMKTMGGDKSQFETKLQGSGEECRTLSMRLSPMTWAGKRHILGIVTDITQRKDAEKARTRKARDEVYGFLASALPVFAMGVSSQVRDTLVAAFADRFESNMRPSFIKDRDQYIQNLHLADDVKVHPEEVLKGYMKWLKRYFSNMGVDAVVTLDGDHTTFELLSCPWMNQAKGNAVFCLLCRAIVIRSFTWTGLHGAGVQVSSIAGGAKNCRFEFRVKNV